jgi:uncharacterized RDD family membrane protein YckC
MNFAISAYCGRCERPLPKTAETASDAPTVPGRADETVVNGPSPSRVALRGLGREGAEPAPRGTPTPVAVAAATAASVPRADSTPPPRVMTTPLVAVPAPLPPVGLETHPPSQEPLELVAPKGRRRPGPNLGDDVPDAEEVAVQLPSTLRLWISTMVDSTLVVGVGALAFFIEALIGGVNFDAPSVGALDALAEWVSAHREIALHAVVVAAVFAFGYGAASALRGGQTLGRRVTNTVLVRKSGKPMSLFIVGVRFTAAALSFALLGAGFWWVLVDRHHRTWHDLVAGTITVRRLVRLVVKAEA